MQWIESLPDDELDPDTAVKMLEDVAGMLGDLAEEDQQKFIRAAQDLAGRPAYGLDPLRSRGCS